MKFIKAPGPGNSSIELLKHEPDILLEILADILNEYLLKGEDIPPHCNLGYIS